MAYIERKANPMMKIILLLLLSKQIIPMVIRLLLLLDVLIVMMNGFLFLLLLFIYPLDIVSIGSIQIKIHDDIVRTLANVRQIPSMSKNLISLSTLDVKGYKYSGGDGILKVSKCSLIFIKGELKSINLYHLRGTIITGNATVIFNSPSYFDATNFWHMHLGHISEQGLHELCKRGLS